MSSRLSSSETSSSQELDETSTSEDSREKAPSESDKIIRQNVLDPRITSTSSSLTSSDELALYQKLLASTPSSSSSSSSSSTNTPTSSDLSNAPLIWWSTKEHFSPAQYAVLGYTPTDPATPILFNTSTPWSTFLCGSQGSGKSHTLSVMLENGLLRTREIGRNPDPLAALVFYYDSAQGNGLCEAAYLCSRVQKTRVLVSASNYKRLKREYMSVGRAVGGTITVERLRIGARDLDVERVKGLMAVGKGGEMPLYMHILVNILREMAIESGGEGALDYDKFRARLDQAEFTDMQLGPLNMRLELLDSMLGRTPKPITATGNGHTGKVKSKPKIEDDKMQFQRGSTPPSAEPALLVGEPNTLTIIDLTDPIIDVDSACALFDICLSIFMSQTSCGKMVALDEAHHFLQADGKAAQVFTESLLKTIREQRHVGARVVIATQEPSLNPKLLDLCSLTIVHRCSSPAWFDVLKKHVAGLFLAGVEAMQEGREGGAAEDRRLLKQIVQLNVGESLLFCPTAAVGVDIAGRGIRMAQERNFVTFRTRQRVTADGGRTRMAGDATPLPLRKGETPR